MCAVERARLAAGVARLEVAEPAAVLHLPPVDHPADDDLLDEPRQHAALLAVEVAEEPLDRLRACGRDAGRAPRAFRGELERDDAGVLPLSPAHEPVLLEPVDEPHRARVRQPEHAGKVVDGAAAVDPEGRQRGRPGSRVARGLGRRRLHGVRQRYGNGAEDVLETQVAVVLHE